MESDKKEIIETKETDNPAEESEQQVIEQPENTGFDKYKQLFDEIGEDTKVDNPDEKQDKSPAEKQEEKVDDKTEDKKDEKIDDTEEYAFEDNKLVINKGETKQELVKVELPDGNIAYVPENLKSGYLMQSDYTKKTQELKAEKDNFQKEKEQIENTKKAVEQLRYFDVLGTPPEKPSIKDFMDPDGKYYNNYENETVARIAYEEAKEKYDEEKETYTKKEMQITTSKQHSREKNLEMGTKFIEKYGQEAFNKTINALKVFNEYVIKELAPLPENAFEIIYKGLIYDEEVKKAELKAKESVFKSAAEKQEVKKVIKGTKTISKPVNSNIPERYKGIMEEATK